MPIDVAPIEERPQPAETVDVRRTLDDGPWGRYQQQLVLLTAITVIFDGADIQLLGIAIPAIMRDWSLARGAFAPILAVGLVGMMTGATIAGLAGDRVGRRRALIGSVLVFGVLTLATATATGALGLGALRFLAGVGLGGAVPNATALASEYVPVRRRALAVTLTVVCIPLGGTLAGLLAIPVLPALGWRALFAIGGVLPIAAALALSRVLPESPRYLARQPRRATELAALLRRMGHSVPAGATFVDAAEPHIRRASIRTLLVDDLRHDTLALWSAFFSCLLAVYLGFNWVPSMLTGAGLSPSVGSAGIAAFNIGGVAGAICGALAFARIGSKPTMAMMAAGAIAGALVLSRMSIAQASAATPIILMLGVTGGLINAVQTTMYALAAHVYPTLARATGVGTAAAVGRGGAIASTFAGAWALEAGGSTLFFACIAAAMVVALASLMLIRRHIAATT